MANKTLKQTVENIESMVRDIAFELKGERHVNAQPLKSARAIPFLSDEDLKKILVTLNNCIYPTADCIGSEKRSLLYKINNELSWKIADILDMDMNGYYYDIETLELKEH